MDVKITKPPYVRLYESLRALDSGAKSLLRRQIRIPYARQDARARLLQETLFERIGGAFGNEEVLSQICAHYCMYVAPNEKYPKPVPFGRTLFSIVKANKSESLENRMTDLCNLNRQNQGAIYWSLLGQFLSIARSYNIPIYWPSLFHDIVKWDDASRNRVSQTWIRHYAQVKVGTEQIGYPIQDDSSASAEEEENTDDAD